MPRVLSVNDTSHVPVTVVVCEIATRWEPDKINPSNRLHSFRTAHCVSARLEAGKWGREKEYVAESPDALWRWVDFVRQAGKPVHVFLPSAHTMLSVSGFWKMVTDGHFNIVRPAHPNVRNIRSARIKNILMKPTKGVLLDSGPPTAVVCYHQSRWRLTITDPANYLGRTCEELSAMLSLPYCRWPLQADPDATFRHATETRCRVWTEAIKQFLEWHDKQELGRFSLTISGIALASFRHRFMRDKIELPEDQDERDFQRSGYYGGWVEALWAGKIADNRYTPVEHARKPVGLFDDRPHGTFHVLDARSFYGAVSQWCDIPVALVESHLCDRCPPPHLDETISECMAAVVINSPNIPFPVRLKRNTVHATGEFITTLCGAELAKAVRYGLVKRWLRWQRYRLAQAARWYASVYWNERAAADKDGDVMRSAVCKSLLAVLHGKWLQRSQRWVFLPGVRSSEPWQQWTSINATTGESRRYRSIGYDVQTEEDAGDAPHCFPAMAAFLTALGREWLRHWVRIAGARHTLYVSTDSLIVDDEGLASLTKAGIVADEGIGSLRIVYSSRDIEIRGANQYSIGERFVSAGRAHKGFVGTDRLWSAETWCGMKSAYSGGGSGVAISKIIVGNEPHCTVPGTVGPGGWITPPKLSIQEQIK